MDLKDENFEKKDHDFDKIDEVVDLKVENFENKDEAVYLKDENFHLLGGCGGCEVVRHGLCHPCDYKYSSAKYYETGEKDYLFLKDLQNEF